MGPFYSKERKSSESRKTYQPLESLRQSALFQKENSLLRIAHYISSGNCKNLVVLSGAGVSRYGWISDLRETVEHVDELNLPHARALLDLDFFMKQQEPLYSIIEYFLKYPDEVNAAHLFAVLLHERGILIRYYTENMDELEAASGLPEGMIARANGSYQNWRCVDCFQKHPDIWFVAKRALGEPPDCLKCGSLLRPDIVFYKEQAPKAFFTHLLSDTRKCDLMIILGSSLSVEPFAYLPFMIGRKLPRLVIHTSDMSDNLDFHFGTRDVFWRGTPEDGCMELIRLLDWTQDLHRLVKSNPSELSSLTLQTNKSSGSRSSKGFKNRV